MGISCTSPSSLFIWYDSKGDRQTKIMPFGCNEYITSDGQILKKPYMIPCGKCLKCKKSKAAEWSNRLVCESKYHKDSCFLTITYDQDHVPRTYDSNGRLRYSLRKSDLQKFIKRLRRYLEYNQLGDIRYYAVGEYGSKTYRPHYHAIIFGFFPDDAEIVKYNSKGQHLYASATLSRLWSFGEILVGRANPQTMFYTAAYVTGKQVGFASHAWYGAMGIDPPFSVMSRKPGIGQQYALDHKDKVLSNEQLVVAVDGEISKFSAPKYFLEQFRLTNPVEYDKIKSERLESLGRATDDSRLVGADVISRRERSDYEDDLVSSKYSKSRVGI